MSDHKLELHPNGDVKSVTFLNDIDGQLVEHKLEIVVSKFRKPNGTFNFDTSKMKFGLFPASTFPKVKP